MQHISVIGRDVAFVVLILLLLGLDEMMPVVAFFSLIILVGVGMWLLFDYFLCSVLLS
jgi:hypothetical protein